MLGRADNGKLVTSARDREKASLRTPRRKRSVRGQLGHGKLLRQNGKLQAGWGCIHLVRADSAPIHHQLLISRPIHRRTPIFWLSIRQGFRRGTTRIGNADDGCAMLKPQVHFGGILQTLDSLPNEAAASNRTKYSPKNSATFWLRSRIGIHLPGAPVSTKIWANSTSGWPQRSLSWRYPCGET